MAPDQLEEETTQSSPLTPTIATPPPTPALSEQESIPPSPPTPALSEQESILTPPPAAPAPPPAPELSVTPTPPPAAPEPPPTPAPPPPVAPSGFSRTQLQQETARLIHVQTDRAIELPHNLSVVHIGKPNDRIPPDVDVSGFPNSEIVSRIHADIRLEGGDHYIEDVGSSNGTYVNNLPLLPGNRHRLRPGDRISLGKGDLVTFLFQRT
jgi:pSer/pThr/pTyr-binding forkhead associated (FHA) protein